MELTGRVIKMLPLQTGQGKSGEWKKQEFILETNAQFPKKVCISVWGDKIEQFNLAEGSAVTVSIDLESREYNGRWYTDVRAWKVIKAEPVSPEEPDVLPEGPFNLKAEEPDDLPF
ncbi:MAG: DUF3127 domain-containing protein [Bacteroidetes bacterium]|nr:DUF3127 domain-containing protein [Bacteroidota bacterium]